MSDKRQQIVETAYRLFKRFGFHATGIDRIIAEAGIAKMTMYRHFPRKDDLIVAVLNERSQRFDRQLDGLAGLPPGRQIAAIVDWHRRWFRRGDFHGCLFAHALAEFTDSAHPVHRAAAAQKDGFRHRLQRILAGILPSGRAEGAAVALAMLIEGATLLAQTGQGEAAITATEGAVAAILSGMGV